MEIGISYILIYSLRYLFIKHFSIISFNISNEFVINYIETKSNATVIYTNIK